MITLFENFVNKSKYEVLSVCAENSEEYTKFQELAFRYGIFWSMTSGQIMRQSIFPHYLYLVLRPFRGRNRPSLFHSDDLDLDFLGGFQWNRKIYDIDNYNELNQFLKYGGEIKPNYEPRKIDKTL